MSSMWIAIMVIAVVSIIAGTINEWHKHKGAKEQNADLEALRERLDSVESNLRDRVETLERIVTDSQSDLKRRIDAL